MNGRHCEESTPECRAEQRLFCASAANQFQSLSVSPISAPACDSIALRLTIKVYR